MTSSDWMGSMCNEKATALIRPLFYSTGLAPGFGSMGASGSM
ncbi:hypothetical protein ACFPFV_01560 [Salinicoccus siamensis]